MSAYIRWLVAQKREWHHPPDPSETALGFQGWHTRGYLPHFDAPGLTQMIGFRLADSLPQALRHEWEPLLQINLNPAVGLNRRQRREQREKELLGE